MSSKDPTSSKIKKAESIQLEFKNNIVRSASGESSKKLTLKEQQDREHFFQEQIQIIIDLQDGDLKEWD